MFPLFSIQKVFGFESQPENVLFSCFRGTFSMKVFIYVSCNFSFTNVTCRLCITLDVLLTVHLSIRLVTDQLNAQIVLYVYYILLHVSNTIVPIARRSNCIIHRTATYRV